MVAAARAAATARRPAGSQIAGAEDDEGQDAGGDEQHSIGTTSASGPNTTMPERHRERP